MNCPLCKKTSIDLCERVNTKDIVALYKRNLKVDIISEFGDIHELGLYSCSDCDLKFFNPVVTGSESFYEILQGLPWYYLDEKVEYDIASRYIKSNDSILEVGCGKGAFARKTNTENYIGLEISQKALQKARESAIEVFNQTIEEYVINNTEKHDVVCSFQVLEHIGDVYGFLACAMDCIRPGGLFIISVPSADSFVSSVTNNFTNLPPHHVTWWTDKSLKSIAAIFQLEILAIHHESLAEMHFQWYSYSTISNLINRVLGRSNRLVDLSRECRILTRLSMSVGKIYVHYLMKKNILPRGHSVTVIYRKSTKF